MSRLFRLLPILLCLSTSTPLRASEAIVLQTSQIQALGIETAVIEPDQGRASGTLPARVLVPNEQMRLVTAPVAGLIERLLVAPGAAVKRGQVVAQLASPQALELQRDALQSASQSSLLQQNLKRDEALFAEGLIAEARLQATRAAASQAGAQADERRQGLALAGIAPGKLGGPLALLAPIDGVVLEQGVQLGQRVDASTLIYRIARLTPLWLEIQAPLGLATGLRIGQPVKLANSDISGRLIAIGAAVDPASQTVLLRAVVDRGAAALIPGQAVEVDIAAPTATGVRLPAAAVVRHAGQTLAFVQTAADAREARFAPRPLRIVSQGGDSVQVDGIKAGERVVTQGASGLKALLAGVGKE